MNKVELIEKIMVINPDLIWEIDQSKFYSLIGHSAPGVDTYWLKENLEELNKVSLGELLELLKNEG